MRLELGPTSGGAPPTAISQGECPRARSVHRRALLLLFSRSRARRLPWLDGACSVGRSSHALSSGTSRTGMHTDPAGRSATALATRDRRGPRARGRRRSRGERGWHSSGCAASLGGQPRTRLARSRRGGAAGEHTGGLSIGRSRCWVHGRRHRRRLSHGKVVRPCWPRGHARVPPRRQVRRRGPDLVAPDMGRSERELGNPRLSARIHPQPDHERRDALRSRRSRCPRSVGCTAFDTERLPWSIRAASTVP